MKVFIDHLEGEDTSEFVRAGIIIYKPAPTYLNKGDKGYDEAVAIYQSWLEQFNRLHLGDAELVQEEE